MSKLSHPIDELELMAYLDGELPRERAAAAAAHVENCQECQTIADDLRNVSQEMAAWQVESSDLGISSRIASSLDGHLRQQESAPRRPRRTWGEFLRIRRVWGWGFASLASLFLIGNVMSNLTTSRHVSNYVTPSRERQAQEAERGANHYASDVNGTMPQAGKKREQRGFVAGNRHELTIPTGPMVIRTAELALIAKDFDLARGRMEDILKRHDGYLAQLSVSGSADSARALTATLRVPADQLDATMAELKKLGRVESEAQKGDEVSQQYVDLQARLTNAHNTEQRLTDILRQRTGKLSDVLAVEQEIASVREQIERMEAEKKNMEKQVAFSTLNVRFTEDYKPQVHVVPDSTSTRIRNAAVDGYETLVSGLINLLLFLVSWGPSLLVWGAILFFPARMMWKRWQKRNLI